MFLVFLASAAAQEGGPPRPDWEEERPAPPTSGPFAHEPEGLGLGLVLGIPTGLSVAWRPGGRPWYDGALAWSFDNGTLHAHADVLFTLADLRTDEIPDFRFPVWLGIGPRLRLGDSPYTPSDELLNVGIRIPLGMAVMHDGVPLEGFLEVAPGIGLYPETKAIFDIALGGRYYFGKTTKAGP